MNKGRQGARAVGLLLASAACLRCATMVVPFPGWDLDPFTSYTPTIGFGPTATILLDSLILALAGTGLALMRLSGGWFVVAGLWALGVAAVVWHGIANGLAIDDLRTGIAWSAAMGAGLSAAAMARDEGARRLMTGVLLGFVAMLAARGAVQLLIEHPLTMMSYEANSEAILEAQGIRPGSPSAALYERRLRQAEASGWFGLSNVYGSVCAAAAAGLAVLAAGAWRGRDRWPAWIAGAGVLIALAATLASRSKGAVVALAIGLAATALWSWLRKRRPQLAGLVLPAVIVIALGAVAARGVIGERSGELSLLFRSYYISTAVEISAQHPVTGVGPDGFKDAYVGLKPPVSPEEVSSPHSVLFDWSSTLGLGGLAWCLLLIGCAWRASRPIDSDAKNGAELPGWGRPVAVTIGLATLAGTMAEVEALLPESAMARIVGVAVWIAVAISIVASKCTPPRAALLAAAAVVLAHAQIEMTLTTDGSAVWCLMLLGLAAGSGDRSQGGRWAGPACGGLLVVAGLGAAWMGLGPVADWERPLVRSAERAGEAAEVGEPAALDAAAGLVVASDAAPAHIPTGRAAGRVVLGFGDTATALLISGRLVELNPESSRAWSHRAWVLQYAALEARMPPEQALEALQRALELDPLSISLLSRAAELAETLGEDGLASGFAERALEADDLLRLDPLKRMPAEQRRRLEAVARRAVPEGGAP